VDHIEKALGMLTLMAGPDSDRAVSNVRFMFFHKWPENASETFNIDCGRETD
jgi:hypothetical protein